MVKRIRTLIIKHRHFILYAISGGINTAVDFLVFTAVEMFTGFAVALCQACGYIAGVISSFILNSRVTFRDGQNKSIMNQLWRFVCVNCVSLAVSTAGIELLTGTAGLHTYVAKVIILVITTVINYTGYKLLVFKVKD